jgi:hypothetical protein
MFGKQSVIIVRKLQNINARWKNSELILTPTVDGTGTYRYNWALNGTTL